MKPTPDIYSIVAIFLNQTWKFRPQQVVLGLPSLTDRYTGENITECVQDILEAFKLCQDKIGYFTLNNASGLTIKPATERLAQIF